jgi:hypothetical protein
MSVGFRDKRAPIAVQFQPPAGFRAGQLGTLVDEKADPRDVTATIVDLAVRGYLRIEQTQDAGSLGKQADFRMIKLREADQGLLPYEARLFSDLFAERQEVSLSALRTTFATPTSRSAAGSGATRRPCVPCGSVRPLRSPSPA